MNDQAICLALGVILNEGIRAIEPVGMIGALQADLLGHVSAAMRTWVGHAA